MSLDTTLSSFSTVVDSPVRDASFAKRFITWISLMSAGTFKPSSIMIKSPGTNSETSTSSSVLSRLTFALNARSFFKLSSAFSALYSWINPRNVIISTIAKIRPASIKSDVSRSPK